MKQPQEYGQYLCLFEGQNDLGKYHYWDIVSWYNHFQDGDCWNMDSDTHQGVSLIRFFELPSFEDGVNSKNGVRMVIKEGKVKMTTLQILNGLTSNSKIIRMGSFSELIKHSRQPKANQ